MELNSCPYCKKEIKKGLLTSNALLSVEKVQVINEYSNQKHGAYCASCGDNLYSSHLIKLSQEIEQGKETISKLLRHIPVITAQSPHNWEYEILNMVTGQAALGTGFLTELSSSFNDFLGANSGRYNNKLRAGEAICYAQLTNNAYRLGGNAVIATDIDYAEIGGDKGMVMVCMSGTAIKVSNIDIFGEKRVQALSELDTLSTRLQYLEKIHPQR